MSTRLMGGTYTTKISLDSSQKSSGAAESHIVTALKEVMTIVVSDGSFKYFPDNRGNKIW